MAQSLEAWQPALAAAGDAKVVVVVSNLSAAMPPVPKRAARALPTRHTVAAERALRGFGSSTAAVCKAVGVVWPPALHWTAIIAWLPWLGG